MHHADIQYGKIVPLRRMCQGLRNVREVCVLNAPVYMSGKLSTFPRKHGLGKVVRGYICLTFYIGGFLSLHTILCGNKPVNEVVHVGDCESQQSGLALGSR
jgi:hypothetical protein